MLTNCNSQIINFKILNSNISQFQNPKIIINPSYMHYTTAAKPSMVCIFFCAIIVLLSCNTQPSKQYGFVTTLGNDTISVESVTRRGNTLTSDEVDRFPRVQSRHTVVDLNNDGSIQHLVMD